MRLGNYFNEIITEKISPYHQIIFIYFLCKPIGGNNIDCNDDDDDDDESNEKNKLELKMKEKIMIEEEEEEENESFKRLIQYSKKIEYKSSSIASLEWLLNTILINDDSNQFYVTNKKEKKKMDSGLK